MKNFVNLLFLLAISACDPPASEKAEVSEAKEVVDSMESTSQGVINYALKTEPSTIMWIGKKPTGQHNGTLGIEQGTIQVYNDTIMGGRIVIDMEDIQVLDLQSDEDSQMKLTEHLRSKDFFYVEKFPEAEFVITNVQPLDSIAKDTYLKNRSSQSSEYSIDNPSHKVTGNLSLRGKTLSVSFPAYILIDNAQLVLKARFIMDRTLWGVSYHEEADFSNKMQDQLIYNDVNVGLDIIANPTKEVL